MKRIVLALFALFAIVSVGACTDQKSVADAVAHQSTSAPADERSNAVKAAQQYLATAPFSHDGLVEQLVVGSKYTEGDAVAAVDSLGADWNDQAAKAAKQYLGTMPFSRDALVQQLIVGSKFTPEQAEFGVSTTGL